MSCPSGDFTVGGSSSSSRSPTSVGTPTEEEDTRSARHKAEAPLPVQASSSSVGIEEAGKNALADSITLERIHVELDESSKPTVTIDIPEDCPNNSVFSSRSRGCQIPASCRKPVCQNDHGQDGPVSPTELEAQRHSVGTKLEPFHCAQRQPARNNVDAKRPMPDSNCKPTDAACHFQASSEIYGIGIAHEAADQYAGEHAFNDASNPSCGAAQVPLTAVR
jgi:hypothetical protein